MKGLHLNAQNRLAAADKSVWVSIEHEQSRDFVEVWCGLQLLQEAPAEDARSAQ